MMKPFIAISATCLCYGLLWATVACAEQYPSPVPREVFPETLAEQEEALKTSPLMLRFA